MHSIIARRQAEAAEAAGWQSIRALWMESLVALHGLVGVVQMSTPPLKTLMVRWGSTWFPPFEPLLEPLLEPLWWWWWCWCWCWCFWYCHCHYARVPTIQGVMFFSNAFLLLLLPTGLHKDWQQLERPSQFQHRRRSVFWQHSWDRHLLTACRYSTCSWSTWSILIHLWLNIFNGHRKCATQPPFLLQIVFLCEVYEMFAVVYCIL